MSPNRRIFLNIVATYGRSLFALVCGLFISRWVLEALGKTDFGLYGVVGGLAIFIGFLNILLSTATSRFYAFSVGQAAKSAADGDKDAGLEECRKWFSTAVMLHTIVPCVLIVVGYPLGIYAIENWLTIPPDRLGASVWVFRFMCISCFIGMINVPFQAMYTAKQYIAELTIYSFFQTTANVGFVYFMVTHPGDWLAKYALWMCVVACLPQVIICMRALKVFPECCFKMEYAWSMSRTKQLSSFAFWQAFGGLGFVLRGQGIQVLINKYFGANLNASMSIANQVSSQTQTLAGAMQSAFQPAIVTALGSGDITTTRNLAFRASKFALILTLLFCLPLAIEIENVMVLWLKNPPSYSVGLCLCMLLFLIVDKASIGQSLACNATGRIAAYQAVGGTCLILCLPLAWGLLALGCSVYSIGWAIVLTGTVNSLSRVLFARKLVGMSAKKWLFKSILPIICVVCVSSVPGFLISRCYNPTFSRLLLTTALSEMLFIPSVWCFVLNSEERSYLSSKIKKIACR